jgi:hypothetical protein
VLNGAWPHALCIRVSGSEPYRNWIRAMPNDTDTWVSDEQGERS